MTVVRPLVLGLVALGVAALPSQAAPLTGGSWRWTTWTPGGGVILTNLTGSSSAQPIAPIVPPPAPATSTWQTSGRWATPPSVATVAPPAPIPAARASTALADAFVNLGIGPYAEAETLTIGGAQPWYTSPVVGRLFGGQPDEYQRAEFTSAVLQHVEQTFRLSGLSTRLTADPTTPAAHTLSVVANTSHGPIPNAIGVAYVGGDGFSFIDKLHSAQSVDELEWAVAHNVAHELMHSYGGEHYLQLGNFVDAASAPWSLLIDPQATFSQDAVEALRTKDFSFDRGPLTLLAGQEIAPQPVPEPMTLAFWTLAATGVVIRRRMTSGCSRSG